MILIITCEHALPTIPDEYTFLFKEEPKVLTTHEAYDLGAYDLFLHLQELADFSSYQNIGRLLVETNRSMHHQKLFSRFSEKLSGPEKAEIVKKYYSPYRNNIRNKISQLLAKGETLVHISIHSFTPVLKSIERNCDIGLLYDPGSSKEKAFCKEWKRRILAIEPQMKIRFNYPYLGIADGFTTYLRKEFRSAYVGIELEVNQKWATHLTMDPVIKKCLYDSLEYIKRKSP